MPRIAILALSLAATAAAVAAPAPTADEVIARNVEARGGAARLRALTVLRRTGRLVEPGQSLEVAISELKTRTGQYRLELTLQGMTQVQAFDGHDAWTIQPFDGRKDPARVSADEAHAFALAADIDLPFVDYRAKGHRVEYLGLQDVDGTPAHTLRVQLRWGDQSTFWIDPDTWMVIRELDVQHVRGTEQVSETDFGDYARVEGVWVAMTEEPGSKDSDPAGREKLLYDHAEANGAAPAVQFAFPAAPAAEAKP